VPPLQPPLNSPADAEARRLAAAYATRSPAAAGSAADLAHRCILAERERRVLALLAREDLHLERSRVLEVGCGSGTWLRDLVRWGARPESVFGVEILADRVAEARRSVAPGVTVERADIAQLPFANESFDIVLQSTVFTSILDDERRRRSAAEMRRVLRRGGVILWYDFHMNNPRNPSVRKVTVGELGTLFPDSEIHSESITLAPPFARILAPLSSHFYDIMASFSPFRTHTLAAIRPR
jgi:SAM-dependent methyltransferase